MTPLEPAPIRPARRRVVAAGLVAVGLISLVVSACVGGGATFDPSGPCVVDGQAPGAYPELEAQVPRDLNGSAPTSVDSGRNCTEEGLGTLADHGVSEVLFAGSTWDLGSGTGVSSAVFEAPGGDLEAGWIAEFYETSARAARKVSNVETSRPTFDGLAETWRLDAVNDLSFQSIVTWQDRDLVRVVLVATVVAPDASREAHDELVATAVRASVEFSTAGG